MSIPQILIVDDDPDRVRSSFGLAIAPEDADIVVRHPQEVTAVDLSRCTLVAVDHFLEHWPERDRQPLAMRPADGFALAAVLRSQMTADGPAPAVAILTGDLPRLAGMLPLKAAEHLLAWQHDIEWVFPKGDAVAPRLVAMSKAVEQFRGVWSSPLELDDIAVGWLDLQDVQWRGVALGHIIQTRPPIHAVGARTTGASILRWFLHRVLPYPAFLTDIHSTATRLGVTAAWLETELQTDSGLSKQLSGCRYSGAFDDFSGPRWWRAGLADMIAELSDGQPFDRTALQDGIRRITSVEPTFLTEEQPVLVVDPKTMEPARIVEVGKAVRISPDGWPFYADDAWASVADACDAPHIADIVLDSSRIETDG